MLPRVDGAGAPARRRVLRRPRASAGLQQLEASGIGTSRGERRLGSASQSVHALPSRPGARALAVTWRQALIGVRDELAARRPTRSARPASTASPRHPRRQLGRAVADRLLARVPMLVRGFLQAGDLDVVDAAPLPTAKDQCKSSGWRSYGVFKSRGDCVSFVATGGRNRPAGP